MDEQQRTQIEAAIVRELFPGITAKRSKKLRKLARDKGIHIFNPAVVDHLRNILVSIIRHNDTNYDSIVKVVGKARARYYIQPIMQERMGG